jgi:predicted SAM-dependent methyltransferase
MGMSDLASPSEQPALGIPDHGLRKAAYRAGRTLLATRTMQLLWFDMLKLRARARRPGRREMVPSSDKLHLGCGSRHVPGWLNADVAGSDCDTDFTRRLPWKAGSFSAVVSQHVVEHLELFGELLPVLSELRRVVRPGGEIWLSCPDMEKICRLYSSGHADELVAHRMSRDGRYSTQGAPSQQIVNDLFHQWGTHKNLFDFGLLKWALESAGFSGVRRVSEADLLERFPGFPARRDDLVTLYVAALSDGS